jgi:flagellar assembly protein FliH
MTASSKQPPRTSPHSRFIPREEIGDVSTWHFSAMDDGAAPPVKKPEPEPEPEATPDLLVEQLLREHREKAHAEGFAQGHEAGGQEVHEAFAVAQRKYAEETAVRMAQLLHNMREHLQKSEEQIARQILDLSVELARQVLRQELRANPLHLRPVITEALAQLVEDGLPTVVRLNPAELAQMKGALLENLGANAPELVADASISPGGCLIESGSMAVDATIEKRWLRAIGNLGLNADWNPENADV